MTTVGFVIRVADNVIGNYQLGSIEYSTERLERKWIIIY